MFYLADAALFALFALALLSLGLGAFSPARPLLEILVLPALATLGALGLLIWLVGSAGLFSGALWAGVFIVFWLAWMIARRALVAANARRLWPALRSLSASEKALALYLLAVWMLAFVLNLAPPNGADYDSLVYHLAVPAQYARLGRVAQLPFDHHSYFPLTMEMLYGVALQLRGPVFAKLFHWLMLPLGALALAALVNRASEFGVIASETGAKADATGVMAGANGTKASAAGAKAGATGVMAGANGTKVSAAGAKVSAAGAKASASGTKAPATEVTTPETAAKAGRRVGGLLAACLFTSLPMTLTEASTAYVDLAFVAFAVAAVLCFAGAPSRERLHDLAWSGAFCGFCLGTKYFGWLIFGFLGIWLLVETLRLRAPGGARALWAFGLTALVLGGGWYLRNWIWVGNPVFPFAYGVFGGRGWTAQMAALYDDSQAIYGFGHSLSDLLMLPWRMAMTPLNVGGFAPPGAAPVALGQPWWPLLPGPIAVSPQHPQTGLFDVVGLFLQTFPGPAIFAFGLPALLARSKPRPLALAAWLFGFLWLFWALTSQQVRYLFPALALLAAVAGWGMATRAPRLMLSRWIGGAALVAWLAFAPYWAAGQAGSAWKVIGGTEPPDAYLTRTFSGYAAMQWLNANAPPDARIAVYGEPRDFYLDRSYFWADDPHNELINYAAIVTGAQLADALKAQNASYILWNTTPGSNGGVFAPPQPQFDEMVQIGRAQLLQDLRGYRVYRLR